MHIVRRVGKQDKLGFEQCISYMPASVALSALVTGWKQDHGKCGFGVTEEDFQNTPLGTVGNYVLQFDLKGTFVWSSYLF